MPIRLCTHSTCPNPAVYRGYCQAHAQEVNRATHRNRHIYNSRRWRLLRRSVLFEQPLCACGCGRLSEDIDHIVPIEQGGAPFDRANTQGLTKACHSKKTRREQAT